MKTALRVASLAAALTAMVSCGVRTEPRPPEDTVIQTRAVRAERGPDGAIHLRWKRPHRSADGRALSDLAGFTVERSGTDGEYRDLASVMVDDNSKVRPQQSFTYTDEHPPPSQLRYRVRAFDSYGQQGLPSAAARVGAAQSEATGPAQTKP